MMEQSETVLAEENQTGKRVVPDIEAEEDVPFDREPKERSAQGGRDGDLSREKRITPEFLDLKKLNIGSATLGWCLFLMVLCIGLSIWKPENELIQDGFEAFKLIALTVLGYIFGSNVRNS